MAQSSTFDRWRTYLSLLARIQVGIDNGVRLESADIVQDVLLEAHRQRDQFRGTTDAEEAAWLRRILTGKIADAWRRLHADKRDIDRERSIQAALEQSSMQLERFLAGDQSSPSERAERNEQLAHMADGLASLPDAQRMAVELRHFQGWSIDAIAQHIQRSPTAVAGLLKRGLQQLRGILKE